MKDSKSKKQTCTAADSDYAEKTACSCVFDGWGAAGKGSILGKIIKNIDPRFLKLLLWIKPTEDEKEDHFFTDM